MMPSHERSPPRPETSARLSTLASLLALAALSSCAGIQSATPVSVEQLRTAPAAAEVGFTNAFGVPSLAERVAERPGLKLSILQVAYAVQGRPQASFTQNLQSFGGVTTWTAVTVPEVEVPVSLALSAAKDATTKLERALTEQGFDVVSHEQVAATTAYQSHYGEWPAGYEMEGSSWIVVGPHPMHVKPATGLISFGQGHLVWPDATALQEIEAELGDDVLFLCLRFQTSTLQGRSGHLVMSGQFTVNDPDFVGYGIGGFGHTVTSLDATTDPSGAQVPGFVEIVDENTHRVHWTPVYEDMTRVHDAFAKGWARELARMAHPPAEG